MKIALHSDFRDYYDHEFCGSFETPDITLERMMENGIHRKKLIKFLHKPIFQEALNANVITFCTKLKRLPRGCNLDIVVYLDPYKHAGEGKILMSAAEAREKYPDHPGSFYIPHQFTTKFLQIGKLAFLLRYSSESWMSNCGDVNIELLGTTVPIHIGHPLYSIDMVGNRLMDFNTSPGLKGTPIEKLLRPEQVYNLIHEYMEKYESYPKQGLRIKERI
ncbi:MAG: hypothetical protein EOM67_08580 [Spirochaetia bacterium]|nr:hypothetical protein [Spirochaetia bacterium]